MNGMKYQGTASSSVLGGKLLPHQWANTNGPADWHVTCVASGSCPVGNYFIHHPPYPQNHYAISMTSQSGRA
jgi:hypothetical protein